MKKYMVVIGIAILLTTFLGLYLTILAYEAVGYWGLAVGLGWFSAVYFGAARELIKK